MRYCDSTLAKGASDSIIYEFAKGPNAIGIATFGDLNNIILYKLHINPTLLHFQSLQKTGEKADASFKEGIEKIAPMKEL